MLWPVKEHLRRSRCDVLCSSMLLLDPSCAVAKSVAKSVAKCCSPVAKPDPSGG
jgi:hypothetical protein